MISTSSSWYFGCCTSKDKAHAPQGTSGKNEAKLMLARAERLEKKMLVLKERAYELDPELKPKKGRPKKTSEEA